MKGQYISTTWRHAKIQPCTTPLQAILPSCCHSPKLLQKNILFHARVPMQTQAIVAQKRLRQRGHTKSKPHRPTIDITLSSRAPLDIFLPSRDVISASFPVSSAWMFVSSSSSHSISSAMVPAAQQLPRLRSSPRCRRHSNSRDCALPGHSWGVTAKGRRTTI